MSAAVFSATDADEVAVVSRNGFIESRHQGSAVVLTPDGEVARRVGCPEQPLLARSTLKPFQALAVMGSGVDLSGVDAVLSMASHTGTPEHVEIVEQLLARRGFTEETLLCPPALPLDVHAQEAVLRTGGKPRRVYMECSGKHAAMLLACAHNDWPVENYCDIDHPLQVRIRDTVERLTGEKIAATAVDGCGTPVFALSLVGLARGVHRFATAQHSSPFTLFRNAATLSQAALANGWALAGPSTPDTLTIDGLHVFSKRGAEGVQVMVAPNGTTVALKILDGSSRAASIVGLRLLEQAGAVDPFNLACVLPQLNLEVFGGGQPVGEISCVL